MKNVLWVTAGLLAAAASALAQRLPDAPGAPRFHVSGYAVEGRALLKNEDFTRVVSPFIGAGKSAGDLERARGALQDSYHDLGHCAIRVRLAHPEPREGVVTFQLSEAPATERVECLPIMDAVAMPGVTVASYVEGGGNKGLSLVMEPAAQAEPSAAPAAARKSSDGAAVAQAAASEPRAKEPAAPAPVAAPQVEPKPAAVAPATKLAQTVEANPAAASPPTVVAQASPAKPAAPVPAPPAPPPVEDVAAPKFDIERFVVTGNTLLAQERIDRTLAPHAGKGKDFGDVQRALESLQAAYQREGYGGVEIRLPEQELERGEVRFRVIEPRIGKITVEGNEHFDNANIRRSVPSLREGVTPNSREIARDVRLANENPAKQATVLLRASEREEELDATVRVADVDPRRFSLSLDNSGTRATHRYRLGLAFQHSNLFNRDHVLTAQYVNAPTNPSDVGVYGMGYRIPFYSLGHSIDFIAGYSDVDSGTLQDLFLVSGKGAVYGVRYNQNLSRWGDVDHRLVYGLEYRAYQNKVSTIGDVNSLVPDITVHPISVTYSANWRQAQQEATFYASVSQNIPGGNDGTDDVFKLQGARFQIGKAGYRIYRFGGSYSRTLPLDWQARVKADGQYTDDPLISGEFFALGGADNIRGFNERYTANDKGYRSNWELYTPDLAKPFGLENSRLRFLGFYDTGKLVRNQPIPPELKASSLDSAGLGLRYNYKTVFTLRGDLGWVYHDGTQQGEVSGRRGSVQGHVSMAWVW